MQSSGQILPPGRQSRMTLAAGRPLVALMGLFTSPAYVPVKMFFGSALRAMRRAIAAESNADITLSRGITSQFRIADPTGNPIAGATARLRQVDGIDVYDPLLTADAAGRIVWEHAPEHCLIAVEANGYARLENIPPADQQNVVLKRRTRLALHVVDDLSGKPIDSCEVTAGDGDEAKAEIYGETPEAFTGGGTSFTFLQMQEWHWARITAEGHLPCVIGPFASTGGEVERTVRLVPAQGTSGKVVGLDGRPAAGTTVMLWTRGCLAFVIGDNVALSTSRTRTDAAGHFILRPTNDPAEILAIDQSGYALATADEVNKTGEIRLQPWAAIEGDVKIGSSPAANVRVAVAPNFKRKLPGELRWQLETTTDSTGHFKLFHVPGVEAGVSADIPVQAREQFSNVTRSGPSVTLIAGQTAHVAIGGTGRSSVGILTLPESLRYRDAWFPYRCELIGDGPPLPVPADFNAWSEEKKSAWVAAYWQTAEGAKRSISNEHSSLPVNIGQDGSVRIDDVVPGTYTLAIKLYEPAAPDTDPALLEYQARGPL